MQNKFNRRIERQKALLKKESLLFNVIGYIKLLLILLFGVLAYFTFAKNFPSLLFVVSMVELIILIIVWIYHSKLHEKIEFSNGIISINERHLDRISGKWVSFEDIGEEFIDTTHPYACDLDIVGQKSLFQFLNTTHTWYGRQAFGNDLLQPCYSNEELLKRQEAIAELSKDIDFANYIEYQFTKVGVDSTAQELVNELKDEKLFIKSKSIKFILTYIPTLIFVFIAAISIFQLKDLYMIGAILVFMQLLAWIAGMPKTWKYLHTISHLPYKLNSYSVVIEILKGREFHSEKLKQIQTELGTSDLSAAHAIKNLSKISDKVNVRHNGIIYFILNVLMLWDYECAVLYEEWKIKYANSAEKWFLALGEIESLLCFSNFMNICNHACLPVITNCKTIEAQEMGHPLIHNDIRVNNNIICNDNIFIISGSNMSGKTTFLRTVGVNLVLGRTGSFVCAKQMIFPPIDITTSMRISDNLNEGISTFYAELKRIKDIIEFAKNKRNMIFLIDEIFRGTNSIDRLSGAKTVLTKLNDLDVMGMITTHDLDLCELASHHIRIKNYNFSEYYKNSEICFDYKMKMGKSNTTNAKFLMEMIGILKK